MIARVLPLALACALGCAAQPYKIAIAGMRHGHVWLNLGAMLKGDPVKLVGAAEAAPEQREWARNSAPAGYTYGKKGPNISDESLIFTDWRKMIDQTKPDIVWAFTPTDEHIDVVRYCAPRGIHVMVEKPLAATYAQAREIQALARKHNILVMANYGSTWSAGQYAVKAAVDAGEIGPVWRLRALTGSAGIGDPKKSTYGWMAEPEKGGGAMVDFGCYSVLWSLWLKGRPESVYAAANHLKADQYPKVDDHATMILNYKDGVAILEATWNMPPAPRGGNEIFGRKGSIVGNTIRKAGTPAAGDPIKADPLPPERAAPLDYMVSRIRTKQPLDGPSALDLNVAVMEVLEAARTSVKTGRAVKLPLRGGS
ncbi:MAG: Gfo/Idh/MocA family oxidoreductase [Acidobacteria bacterium]|nr:Gfo/Idh/MocA family oxidoreductase [Acidobacteriota bacterium]